MASDVLILSGARTPFCVWTRGRTGSGARGGALADRDPFDLGAAAAAEALKRSRLSPEEIDRVVFGNVYAVGPHACYGARYVSLRAGLSHSVPSYAVGMACGTGLQVLIEAAEDIAWGRAGAVLCGGSDSPSLVGKEIFAPSFFDLACGKEIGATVEALALGRGISRESMDAFSAQSHRRARAARSALREEIVSVNGIEADDAVLQSDDPAPFASAKLHFGGVITSRNTHAIVDGGSALVLADEKKTARSGVEPLGRWIAGAAVGVEPEQMGYASVPAILKLLDESKRRIEEIDLFEINETFAAQMLLDSGALGIPPEKLNVNGGAIALGHPFAGTGCKLVHGLLLSLKARGLKTGVAAICVGGGQGVAVLVERL